MSSNTIEIVMGDWSADGHGKTETVVISTDFTAKEIEKAFKAGAKKCGHDITQYCEEYEDSKIPNEVWDYFDNLGVKTQNIRCDEEDEQWICDADYVLMYLKTCEIGDKDFKYTVSSNHANKVHIGGYGLFGS